MARIKLSSTHLADDTQAELVVRLYGNLVPAAMMAVAFTGAGLTIVHRNPDPWLGAVLAMGVGVSLLRLTVIVAFRFRQGDLHDPRVVEAWEWAYGLGSFTFSALLGAFLAQSIVQDSGAGRTLALALLFGYACGVVTRLSIRPWISVPSLGLAVALPIGAFASLGGPEHLITAAVLTVFSVGSMETATWIYRSTIREIELRRELAGLARHDSLTGLANRLLLWERLNEALARQKRDKSIVALHLIDLDRFKPVNDRLGHPVGDALLKAVGERLRELLRPGDLAARLGGDEFVILQCGLGHEEEAELMARRIVRYLRVPFAVEGHLLCIGGSVGVAIAPNDGGSPSELFARADAALYRTKTGGRNAFTRAGDERALAS